MSKTQFRKFTKEERAQCRLVTPVFRVSYPHLFEPQRLEGSKPKFSVTMLFPKDTDLADLKRALKNVKTLVWGKDKEKWPELESPVSDGDSKKFREEDGTHKPGYKNHWVVRATSNEDQKPSLVDYPDANPILNRADFYAGCYARASILAYPWEYMGKKGVGFIVDHVQKVKDGEPFSSKPPASAVFAPIEGLDSGDTDDDEVGDF